MRHLPLLPSPLTMLIEFTAKGEKKKRDKKDKYKAWLIDTKYGSKEFLNIFLDFLPDTGATMQQIEFRAKLVAKK